MDYFEDIHKTILQFFPKLVSCHLIRKLYFIRVWQCQTGTWCKRSIQIRSAQTCWNSRKKYEIFCYSGRFCVRFQLIVWIQFTTKTWTFEGTIVAFPIKIILSKLEMMISFAYMKINRFERKPIYSNEKRKRVSQEK